METKNSELLISKNSKARYMMDGLDSIFYQLYNIGSGIHKAPCRMRRIVQRSKRKVDHSPLSGYYYRLQGGSHPLAQKP
jgi:hypothetical protein